MENETAANVEPTYKPENFNMPKEFTTKSESAINNDIIKGAGMNAAQFCLLGIRSIALSKTNTAEGIKGHTIDYPSKTNTTKGVKGYTIDCPKQN
ncbi:unnamed protein product [Toxocara canis]|uniref:DUF3987 domain-containing protein n=1 Tax=Toxocara canis TaxID=6265 RepID=A0A183UIC0_TOXCA|nr:unnamed protein product [Toxocara canis]